MDKESIKKEIDDILQSSLSTVGKTSIENKEALKMANTFQTARENEDPTSIDRRTKSKTSVKSMTQHYIKGPKVPQNSRAQEEIDHDELPKQEIIAEIVNEVKEKLIKLSQANLNRAGESSSKVLTQSKSAKNCSCAMKQLSAIKAGKKVNYKPRKQPSESLVFQNRPRDPVAFRILPEEDVKKPVVDPEEKFFFGKVDSLAMKPEVRPLPQNASQEQKQLNDPTQSVLEIVENVHTTAEKLLIDTEKALENLELKDENMEEPRQIDLPELKEFGFTPVEQRREQQKQAEQLKEDAPEPMIEVLEDPLEEINKRLFESTLKPEFFASPILPRGHDTIAFEFSPVTGALKYEKRSSSQNEEQFKNRIKEAQVECKSADEKSEGDQELLAKGSKLRRASAAEDLSVVGKKAENLCGCEPMRSKIQSPLPCVSVDASTERFIAVKLNEAAEKQGKKIGEDKTEAENKTQKGKALARHSWLKPLGPITQMYSPKILATLSESYKKQETKKEEDDDGFVNLPEIPSTVIKAVSSSAWIDDNLQFYVTETPSVQMKSPLGKASEFNEPSSSNPAQTGSIENTQEPTKKKDSKIFRVKSFVKRLPNIFRSNKD